MPTRGPREVALEDLGDPPAERFGRRDAGNPFGHGVPEDDSFLAIDGHDSVGDVEEDRVRALLLLCDALVELGVRQTGGRDGGERRERLRLLLAPCSRPCRIHGEDAVKAASVGDHRHRDAPRHLAREERISVSKIGPRADVVEHRGGARLDGVAKEACPDDRARSDQIVGRITLNAGGRPDDELFAVEKSHGGCVRIEEDGRLADDLLEDDRRIEHGDDAGTDRCESL